MVSRWDRRGEGLTARREARAVLSVCLRRAWDAEAEVAAAAATTGSAAAMLFAGLLGGSGGRLLGVTGSAGTRGVTMGEKGALRKVEMSCMSRCSTRYELGDGRSM